MRGTRRSALRNQALCGVVIRSTVGSQSIPGGNFRIRCFFAIWAFVGCAGGGEALQPLLALEDDDFDLLVMGRTQGKGCYCYVNGLLQAQLAKYQNNYPYFVVDNEAGMEHISRGVLPGMQTAILVSDCSRRGIQAVGRIAKLIEECNMHPATVGLIVNRAPKGELNPGVMEEIENQGLKLLGVVPQDEAVYEYDCEGRPTASLPEDNPVKQALRKIVDNLEL